MSNGPTPLLTHELLAELDTHWRRQHAPLRPLLRPGLSDREMDALVAPLGLRLPAEARTWWGWHDGVPASAVLRDNERNIGAASSPFLPLAEAAHVTIELRDVLAESEERPGDQEYWRRDWLVITQQRGPIVIDCSVADGEPAPVHLADFGALGPEIHHPRARSLGELVQWWLTAFEVGAWRYHIEDNAWIYDWGLLPEPQQRSWLV